jgi:hypothetical protein
MRFAHGSNATWLPWKSTELVEVVLFTVAVRQRPDCWRYRYPQLSQIEVVGV